MNTDMKKSSIKIISLLVVVTMALSSCLKDLEDFTGQFSSSPYIAELSEAANAATGTVAREIINPTQPATFQVRVNIASAFPLDKDTKVTLALDNALITAYNTAKGLTGAKAAVPVPAAALTVPSYDVVIPAGKREADFSFTIDASKLPNSLLIMYLLPVKIASAENNVVVSGNFGTQLVRVLARNKYDGIYHVTGTFTDYVSAAFTGYYPKTISLTTVSSDVVTLYDVDEELNGYLFDTGAGLSYFGAWTLAFKFDIATDAVIDVFNTTADPAPRSRQAVLYTGAGAAANKFNADKSIDVSFQMKQMNVTPNLRNLIKEHYTYVGPRE
jgi:hypothetical protein